MISVSDKRSRTYLFGPVRYRTSWLALLVALVSLLVAACSSDGGGVAATATSPVAATATPSATATATPEPTPVILSKSEKLASIGDAVTVIRELPAVGEPNVSLVDKARIAQELAEDLEDPEVLAEIAELDPLLKLLGLIPPDSDLLEIETALLEGAVVGLYNHETGELMVLTGEDGVSVKEEAVYSHEYAHLLQDENFDLSELYESAKDDSERTSALQALVEGEATFVEAAYALENFSLDDVSELIAVDPADVAVLETTPDFLLLALGWPYTTGYGFVDSIWQDGGMAALDAVWLDLPETTEQVIHPEKYLANEYPKSPPELPDMTLILGDGWTVNSEGIFGEAFTGLWLEALGVEHPVAAQAAAGWGRDAYTVLNGPDGQNAMGMLFEWDDPATDALQFSAALEQALDADPTFTVRVSSDAIITSWDGQGGVLSFALDATTGAAGVAVAPTLDQAKSLLGALVTN